MQEKRVTKYHVIKISGSAYEGGKQLGKFAKQNESFVKMLTSLFPGQEKMTLEEIKNTIELFEQICPGITDEIKGFADEVGVDITNIIYYYAYIRPVGGQCSLISILPEAAQDGCGMLGRNYEFAWDDYSILIESVLEGQYRQIGFGCQLFGKFEGINEHGLCVATAAGVINPQYREEGFVFPVIVRAILNRCRTVDEALEFYGTIKTADFRNYIIMDAEGNSALIEAAASKYDIKRSKHGSTPFLFATNHYESQQLRQEGFYTPNHSKLRYRNIKEYLHKAEERISNKQLKNLLATPMPDGICCHYYEDGMGTMWSMIFHPQEKTVEVCFGSADNNEWRTFSFCDGNEADSSVKEYEVILHNQKAPANFWKEGDGNEL